MRKKFLFHVLLAFFSIFMVTRMISPAQAPKRALAVAQPDQAAIAAVTPGSLSLQQGGPAATLAVNGKRLDTILSAFAVRDGRRVREIAVKLVPPWPSSGKVGLQAGAGAPVAQGYQLRVVGKAGLREYQFDVPLTVFSLEVTPPVGAQMQTAAPLQRVVPPKTLTPVAFSPINLYYGNTKNVIGYKDPRTGNLVFTRINLKIPGDRVQRVSKAEHQALMQKYFPGIYEKKLPYDPHERMWQTPDGGHPLEGIGKHSSDWSSFFWSMSEGGASCQGGCVNLGNGAYHVWEYCSDYSSGGA